MKKTALRTRKDCEDFLEGALWMGTGGGTRDDGLTILQEALDQRLALEWVDRDSIPDDVWTATVGLHGSIAPLSQEVLQEIDKMGLKETDEWYVASAVKELGDFLGHQFKCLVAPELGPESVAIPLVVGARLGIPVIDGDYIGRAVPEEMQSTYCLHQKQSHLFAGVDPWGNVIIVKQSVNTTILERFAKMLALASYGVLAVATTPLIAREMKEIIVPGTLSRCLEIGRVIRSAKETGKCPIDEALEVAGAWRLFDGTVTRLETDDRDGYLFGTVYITGTDKNDGQTLTVWFKNENQVSWLDGNPWVCSPDLITLVDKERGRGFYNSEIHVGDDVVVIGIRGVEAFRTEAGLELAGPRHFGFDIDYVPIEKLMKEEQKSIGGHE
jgi:uncharacterized protein